MNISKQILCKIIELQTMLLMIELEYVMYFSVVLEFSTTHGSQWEPLYEECADLQCFVTMAMTTAYFHGDQYHQYVQLFNNLFDNLMKHYLISGGTTCMWVFCFNLFSYYVTLSYYIQTIKEYL
jgi:hypothetical protein